MDISRRSFLKLAGAGTIAATLPKTVFAAQPQRTFTDYSFVQVTDTHIPDPGGIERSRKVVDAVNALSLPYEIVIHTGDASNGHGDPGDMKRAHELLRFAKKTYFIPGNADITFDHPERFESVFAGIFGPCDQVFYPVPGLRFVLFNSQPLSDRAETTVREQAFARLNKMLQPSMPTLVFCHATGMPDFYVNVLHRGWKEKTMRRWAEMMTRGGVMAVLAGHFHRDESLRLGDIPVHICSPVVGWWGRQATFRHWTIDREALTYRTVYI